MEQRSSLSSLLEQCSQEIGVPLRPEQVKQLLVHFDQLKTWSQSINLTSIRDDQEIIVKHFIDSLACFSVESIKKEAWLLDVGTGAGFPGIPLKIVRDDLHVTLVEPVKKKASFLLSVIGILRLKQISVFCGTLRQFIVQSKPFHQFDYIVTRALKPDEIFEQGERLLANHGKIILYLAKPFNQLAYPKWVLTAERQFDLPMKFGRRVLSILERSPKKEAQVSSTWNRDRFVL
ncbi:16S rRNA (guanine(527)-N(7))-methyltransferase RsmG [Candidatus Nitrospira inopinata]|uniref:16S rRNA (guanine(527)-N(7))-methyltransferase RsmG n=1 Tax=Candidatus Nitrospira inopinata TaxID=1715989 RepID=UPI001300D307|nr:16S rRNA (guanine(527)-N(7))-methyltransferase RsmG [Candidatus Nitrospira inopinata]